MLLDLLEERHTSKGGKVPAGALLMPPEPPDLTTAQKASATCQGSRQEGTAVNSEAGGVGAGLKPGAEDLQPGSRLLPPEVPGGTAAEVLHLLRAMYCGDPASLVAACCQLLSPESNQPLDLRLLAISGDASHCVYDPLLALEVTYELR